MHDMEDRIKNFINYSCDCCSEREEKIKQNLMKMIEEEVGIIVGMKFNLELDDNIIDGIVVECWAKMLDMKCDEYPELIKFGKLKSFVESVMMKNEKFVAKLFDSFEKSVFEYNMAYGEFVGS